MFKYNKKKHTKGHVDYKQILHGTNGAINPESCKPCRKKPELVLPRHNAL